MYRFWIDSEDGHRYIIQADRDYLARVIMGGRSIPHVIYRLCELRNLDRCIMDDVRPCPKLVDSTKGSAKDVE